LGHHPSSNSEAPLCPTTLCGIATSEEVPVSVVFCFCCITLQDQNWCRRSGTSMAHYITNHVEMTTTIDFYCRCAILEIFHISATKSKPSKAADIGKVRRSARLYDLGPESLAKHINHNFHDCWVTLKIQDRKMENQKIIKAGKHRTENTLSGICKTAKCRNRTSY